MRLNKEKLQKLTFLAKNAHSQDISSSQNTFFYTQKLGRLSKPSTRQNSVQKRQKSRDKIPVDAFQIKREYKSIRSTMISRCGSFELTQPVTPKKNEKHPQELNRRLFKFHYKVGSGAFGKVWKVEEKKNRKMYAMKEICKALVMMKKSVESILNQKTLLCQLNNPFLVNMKCAFQDTENLYIVLDYLSGGDLRYHLFTKIDFTEAECKFMVACIVLSLEYLRDNNIIHRDLKPENLVFESSGYLRLTDFGVARAVKPNNSKQTSGTPGYMAPQVLCHMNHSFEVDYYALGIIAYEMVFKRRPYMGYSRKQIRELVLAKEVTVKKSELPPSFSDDIVDFINRLICRNKDKRLGKKSFTEIKKHPWLSTINWSLLRKKQLRPPFVPQHTCQNQDYLEQLQTEQVDPQVQQMQLLLRNPEVQKLFGEYNYEGSRGASSYNLSEILRRL